jgi:alkylated DNA repair dioxygenase AlkB
MPTDDLNKQPPAGGGDAARAPVRLDMPDADVTFHPAFFAAANADRLFRELLETTAWRQEGIKLYGRSVDLPRLTAWYGDEAIGYRYSGIDNIPLPWTAPLLEVKRAVEPVCGVAFNGVLLNRYRTGRDSVSWHSDDEPEFGTNPVIASVSFGATRAFQFKHKKRKELRAGVELTHGSLLVMAGTTQHHWLHQIPKVAEAAGERINLTFRLIIRPPAVGPN